jgi:thermitase
VRYDYLTTPDPEIEFSWFSNSGGAMKKLSWILSFILGVGGFAQANSSVQFGPHKSGELLVQLKSALLRERDSKAEIKFAIEKKIGVGKVVHIHELQTDKTIHLVRLSRDKDLLAAIETLKVDPNVLFAEPNYLVRMHEEGIPNDPDFDKTWSFKNVGQVDPDGQEGSARADINILPIWATGFHGSKKIVVAIADTGIDWVHPDIAANLYVNPLDSTEDGKDNDGNGFPDDIHGWNFSSDTNDSRDDHNHGTHVGGVIGAVGNNTKGICGVNWDVSLMPLKFLDKYGYGEIEGAINAINYATMMKVHVINNSWGGGPVSEILKGAFGKARDAGILVIASAGNDGSNNDITPVYPANYKVDNIVSVAASDNKDSLAKFKYQGEPAGSSNFGRNTVHVTAPGSNIYSSIPGGYEHMSGTSMAAPHVSGLAALLWAANPTWTYSEIKDRLIKTSDPITTLTYKTFSGGRVNAYNALMGIQTRVWPEERLWKPIKKVYETQHPYEEDSEESFELDYPNAKYLRLHFQKIETKGYYDSVILESPEGDIIEQFKGSKENVTTGYIVGGKAVLRLKTGYRWEPAYGFKVDRVEVIE